MAASTKMEPAAGVLARPIVGIVLVSAALALVLSLVRGRGLDAADRSVGLQRALAVQGIVVDPEGILWLDKPPYGTLRAATSTVAAVVRASPAPEEPHDIFLVFAKLSPEGVLLDVRGAYNLTETSAVDEKAPVGSGSHFAFAEQAMLGDERPSVVRLLDLGGGDAQSQPNLTSLERLQVALTRLQKTGRLSRMQRVTYGVEPAPEKLSVAMSNGSLRIEADRRSATIAVDAPLDAPEWLSVEKLPERRPGKLVNWAVDRVRAEVGDETMQYIKAIAFSALDTVLSSKEAVTGDTGEADIAADLGQESLEPISREIPVDPEIGFPPKRLELWVKPGLPGEGVWHAKDKDPFIHTLPGLPPTFVTTFIRGDRRRKVTRVYIALWDPRLVELNMMAGLAEPKSATGATGPGLIPREPTVLKRVAAAMNAGFQALHGEYGMMSDGVIYLPPKPYAATVAKLRDGSTAFGSWPTDPTIPQDMLSYRQNMTVMVLDEKFNPYGRTWWGGTPAGWEDRTHTTRTAICLTKENFVGYFYGADLSPRALARAMQQARCAYGVALDMNAGHSGLEFYKVAPAGGLEPLGRPLRGDWERTGKVRGMEGWEFRARRLIRGMGLMYFPRYIGREGRDFFYVTLRYVLPGKPLAPLDGAKQQEGDGTWRVKGLPQHGFPYALATTEVALPSGARARVLKIDPRMITIAAEQAANGPAEAPRLVALVDPNAAERGAKSLWFSSAAFSITKEAPTAHAVRIASGVSPAGASPAAAGVGVDEGAMMVYIEVVGDKPAPSSELAKLLAAAGAHDSLMLEARLPIALGGDTNLEQQAIRLPSSADQVRLLRRTGPGARRIFGDTPIVPLKEWFPLQARRIRYFKKKKKEG